MYGTQCLSVATQWSSNSVGKINISVYFKDSSKFYLLKAAKTKTSEQKKFYQYKNRGLQVKSMRTDLVLFL